MELTCFHVCPVLFALLAISWPLLDAASKWELFTLALYPVARLAHSNHAITRFARTLPGSNGVRNPPMLSSRTYARVAGLSGREAVAVAS